MKKAMFLLACGATFGMTACSQADQSESAAEVVEAATDSAAPAGASSEISDSTLGDREEIPATMPQLAYDYGLSYRLSSGEIGKLMRRHANVCEQQGPMSCRIIGMDLLGDAENDDARGTLQLAVAAPHARAVSALLEREADDAGAEQVSATIGSEEVSKAVVDTEARIRAREELRDRLMEVLRTRKGSVKELVEAERSVAAVNEEIDQAKSWLAETKGRVAFSRMDIDYAPAAGVGTEFTAPIEGALGSLGGILGGTVAVLIVLLAIGLPVGGAIAGLVWLRRRLAVRNTPRNEEVAVAG